MLPSGGSPSSPMSEQPFVSVIVPVWDDRERLAVCLKALSRQDYPDDKFEVIVVDNGSQDHPELLETAILHTRFAQENEPGSYRARNAGIRLAQGDVLAFTDADCLPSETWITNGVRHLCETKDVGLVAGHLEVVPRDREHPSLAELYEMVLAFPQRSYVERGHFGGTGNLFTTREVLAAVGGFEGSLKSGGDAEWGRRVFASGRRLVFADDARVVHPARASVRELVRKARRVAGGMAQMQMGNRARLWADQLKELVPPPLFLVWIWTSKDVRGAWKRLSLVALLIVLRQVRFWERLRIILGGVPLRG